MTISVVVKKAFALLALVALGYFGYLMLAITLQYIPLDTKKAFLRIKDEELKLAYYLPAFLIHVYTSIFLLLAGFTQFSKWIRTKYRLLHRRMGWMYIVVLLAASAPSGFIMALHANGGWTSKTAFILLAILWIIFTSLAIYYAIKKNWIKHRNFMIRSYALTLSAITLRLWKWIIVSQFETLPMDTYRIVAWLGWVLNLVVAEIIIYKKRSDA